VFRSRLPAKVKAQAEPREIDRSRLAGTDLPQETRALHTAIANKLHILNVKRALKGAQLNPTTPELHKRQAGLREKRSPEFFDWEKIFQGVLTPIGSREREAEIDSGFRGGLR